MKESGLRIRVDSALRGQFVDTCRALDTTAAQVLRSYMRQFVVQNEGVLQDELFPHSSTATGFPSGGEPETNK